MLAALLTIKYIFVDKVESEMTDGENTKEETTAAIVTNEPESNEYLKINLYKKPLLLLSMG